MHDLTTARFLVGRRGGRPLTRIAEPWEGGGVPLVPPRQDTLLQDLWRVLRSALS
ncbi:hypothetical protein [Novispirillum itersonii]|uniref:Uncharacterized protein n=1 Tax=Novispirillum itersonii TaxID=189 RepID=A0A7X0DPK9_NOVIT|nr:hypothetical protein [Novispirillum itersonii]MBB6212479.1 hypothetical protein [Novispirillum itersonii]